MDALLERLRAANTVTEDEFAGLADFDALVLDPPRRPRRRRRLLAFPAAGAIIAALVLVPTSAPQASEILRNAVNAVAVDDGGILYARSQAESRNAAGEVQNYGSRQVWVLGDGALRWLAADGLEEVFKAGEGTTSYDPRTGKVLTNPGARMEPAEIFRVAGLLQSAMAGKDIELEGEATVNGRPAYVLRWTEKSGPPHWPTIDMTLWVDKETSAPLRYSDHSYGKAADGKPFDTTYTENVLEFKTLPDTPANRKLLELSRR
jgi:outer membrane lipoprotein-sorting protein